ncbi:unnamed protein product [Didymodactylos carnosus]|uniref:Caspase family p20 domain-containing protein n=1 Tax=Didymodactylos carnosus TaxID=1234261 RepID=A0A814JDY1_9BILA|nr:unnamed protein product [Didymodactylos carnosus]CAF3806129.1 unnamed protein product [Didymodactylos carnosus]
MCAALIPTVQRRKVAMTIGNNNYDAGALENCVFDATDLSDKLKEIGFSVTLKINLRSEQMRREIEKFVETIRRGDLVFFFFAGHGTQWEDQNYLLPCDHNLDKGSVELRNQSTNAQDVLALLSNKNPFVIVFLLDCCRDYWTPSQARGRSLAGSSHRMPGSSHRTAGSSQGMTRMAAPPNSLIGFACAPGEVADDESLNRRNGRFTSHILQHITRPGEEVIMLLVDVAHGVVAETHGTQRPFTTSSFYQRGIWLVPPKTLNPTPVQPNNEGGVTGVVSHVFQKARHLPLPDLRHTRPT